MGHHYYTQYARVVDWLNNKHFNDISDDTHEERIHIHRIITEIIIRETNIAGLYAIIINTNRLGKNFPIYYPISCFI